MYSYNKMAVLMIISVIWSLMFLPLSASLVTRVEVTAPVQSVTTEGILAIQCKIWNLQDDYTVKLFRVTHTRTDEITSDNTNFLAWAACIHGITHSARRNSCILLNHYRRFFFWTKENTCVTL